MDRFDLYELCVQSPRRVVDFLHAVHAVGGAGGANPAVLREDFCGTAAFSRRWIERAREHNERARAIAIDLDEPTLAAARERAQRDAVLDAIDLRRTDAIHAPDSDPADITFVGNFSIGEIHARADLVHYFRASLARLHASNAGWGAGSGGVLVVDTYGGAGAFKLGALQRTHVGKRGEVVHYTWQHVAADPTTSMVENAIHFRVIEQGELTAELPSAFIYRWRLWSIAELREAMSEAGFGSTEVHAKVDLPPGVTPTPVSDPAELPPDWIVCVVGRG